MRGLKHGSIWLLKKIYENLNISIEKATFRKESLRRSDSGMLYRGILKQIHYKSVRQSPGLSRVDFLSKSIPNPLQIYP